MKVYKQLAGQTAMYGLSSIVGRLLNYLLVPLYTRVFEAGEYGVVTQLYAYVTFFNILFTYGLETSFFRYTRGEEDAKKVYSTSALSIIFTSLFFTSLIILFSSPIASGILIGTKDGSVFIKYFACILAFEAISAIPFALLRQQNKAKRFVFLKLVNIGINIGLNLFFLLLCPFLIKNNLLPWLTAFYDPGFGVGYVFLSNLISTTVTLIMLGPELKKITFKFDTALWKQMITYSFPLMVAGFAGMINETFDRILIPFLLKDKSDAMIQLGIYGACYKISIIMTLFIQTFRYAAEPFFFNHSTKENPQLVYAQVMKLFIIICAFIFLAVMLYMDIIKYFIGPDFRSGLGVVPILLMANLCLGVFYNLSIWYKLTDKTKWGAWLSIFGAVITIGFNILLIPVMGYMGAAWATLICYASIMVISYLLGQRHYKVPYSISSFFFYVTISLLLWYVSIILDQKFNFSSTTVLGINTLILVLFVVIVWASERKKINYLRRE